MLTYASDSRASPVAAWDLIARPSRWHEWAPHVRGAVGLGDPFVRAGASGRVRLFGVALVPATITGVVPGRSWTWRVGPLTMTHRVAARRGGAAIAIDVLAAAPVELAVRASYGPLIALLVLNAARVAAAQPRL